MVLKSHPNKKVSTAEMHICCLRWQIGAINPLSKIELLLWQRTINYKIVIGQSAIGNL